MPTEKTVPFTSGVFFITFTCYKWLDLIEQTNCYDMVYKWFDYLNKQHHRIVGYVIMPNHVHVIIAFVKSEKSINTIVGNGKRFIAYEIINRLNQNKNNETLNFLSQNINEARKLKNKKHNVWELSFDWKHCESEKFIIQKLDYIHQNPKRVKYDYVKPY